MGKSAKKAPKFLAMEKAVTSNAIKQHKEEEVLNPNKKDLTKKKLPRNLDLEKGMMDYLYKCTPCITDCVMTEIEKLGQKYHVALRIAKDPRFERLPCAHEGTYADDCIIERVTGNKCYIVATCGRDLKRRIRKVPSVPIMYITQHKYSIERLPEAMIGGAPKF